MWLDRAQKLLAVMVVILGGAMVVFGVASNSWPGMLLVIGGVLFFGSSVWFLIDANRRMDHRRERQRERGIGEAEGRHR